MNYWSTLQAMQRPSCLALPKTTKDVSIIMTVLTSLRAPFTVKAGGHTAFTGGSNIDDGITIDLVHLNETSVSDDRRTVSVGPGARWVNVSTVLDPMNLAVLGGRDANVGVAGLLLGGGFSFFSSRHGWACDNVRKYEVVLASGKVVYASPLENPDLYKALRGGGGSSFGIVTRFDLEALEQGNLWTNTLIFPSNKYASVAEKFTDLVIKDLDTDLDAHTYFVMINSAAFGGPVALVSFYHSVPPPKDEVPSVFQPFQSLPGAFVNTTLVSNVTTLSKAISNPYGHRRTWSDLSFRLTSAETLNAVIQVWEQANVKMSAAAGKGYFISNLANQPITKSMMTASQKNGGNSLSLNPEDGPLIDAHFSAEWDNPQLDDFMLNTVQEMATSAKEITKREGVTSNFVYMNYAGHWQDPLRDYGEESYKNLQKVSAKYDPEGTLKKLWKDYFRV